MAQAMAGKLLISRWNSEEITENSDDYATSFSNTVFGFLEEKEESPNSESRSSDWCEEEDEENPVSIEENKKFWETQNQLLQATLCRTSSLESKVRQATKDALREINRLSMQCTCGNPVAGGCRNCLQREVSVRLRKEGYNCAVCKSKWKTSQDMPAGEHTYLEVVEKLSSQKGQVRVVIELNFRAEFEMARANEDYNQLINRLPEVYVGKSERLKALIKILCSAAKKSMKEKKMHLGPWRKHKYMQCKWVGTCERTTPAPLPAVGFVDRTAKPRASMLTCDLLDAMPIVHRTAVQVL